MKETLEQIAKNIVNQIANKSPESKNEEIVKQNIDENDSVSFVSFEHLGGDLMTTVKSEDGCEHLISLFMIDDTLDFGIHSFKPANIA